MENEIEAAIPKLKKQVWAMPKHVVSDPLLKYFWNRLRGRDMNLLVAVVGETGSCKSGSSCSLAWALDLDSYGRPRFNLDRVVFTAQEFMDLVANGKLPKYSVIVWDEVQVEGDNREFYSMRNKFLKYIFTTFRYKNYIVFLTTPNLKGFDLSIRQVLHGVLIMKGQEENGEKAVGIYKHVTTDSITGKVYYKIPRFYANGILKKLDFYSIPRPPAEFEIAYKEKKDRISSNWYSYFNQQMDFMKRLTEEKNETALGVRAGSVDTNEAKLLENPKEFFNPRTRRFNAGLIAQKLGLALRKSERLCSLMNAKLARGEIVIPEDSF